MMNLRKLSFAVTLFSVCAMAQTQIEPSWSLISDQTNTDNATDLYVNPQGESFVIGHIGALPGFPFFYNLMLMKVSADGTEQWRKFIHPANDNWQLFATAVTGDDDGNIIVVYTENYRYSDYISARVVVRKYDGDGNIIWSNYLTDNVDGLIESLTSRELVFKDGDIYVVGSTYQDMYDNATGSDGLIYHIDGETGGIEKKIIYDSEFHTDDMLREIRVSDAGEIYAIGRSRGYAGPGGIYSNYDALTVKFGANGNFLWNVRHNGTGNAEDWGINLDIDDQGNVYTSSQIKILSISQRQVNVHKISPSGNVLWNYAYMGSSSGWNWDQPVEVLANGNVVLVGSGSEGITIKCLDPDNGSVIWTSIYNRNNAGAVNHQRYMISDAESNIYITGTSRDTTPMGDGYDMVTLKYTPGGTIVWESNYTHSNYDGAGDDGVKMDFDADGNVYAIGWTQDASYDNEFLLLKFGSSLATPSIAINATCVYPNPAVDVLNIIADGALQINRISLYDLAGRIIEDWTINEMTIFSNQVSFSIKDIASATYLLAIDTPNGRIMRKIQKI